MALDFKVEPRVQVSARQTLAGHALGGLRNHALGHAAESLVAEKYKAAGHVLLAHRWRSARGEIDLILRSPQEELIFVEVKCSRTHEGAAALLSAAQVRRIYAAADDFLADHIGRMDVAMRFDLALVDAMARIDIIENAFL